MVETPESSGAELLAEGASVNQLLVTGAALLFLLWAGKKTIEGILGKQKA